MSLNPSASNSAIEWWLPGLMLASQCPDRLPAIGGSGLCLRVTALIMLVA